MLKKIVYIFCCIILLSACDNNERTAEEIAQQQITFETGKITINNVAINIDLAVSNEQKTQGLMNIKSLPNNYGMLFIYEKERNISMWMKDTYVSLDMFFIDKNGVIKSIEKNTSPLSLNHIKSNYLVKYVLETKAGFADKYNIEVGNKIMVN